MDSVAYPKKINTAFIKTVASNYDIDLVFHRDQGYSVFIRELPTKRWMMVDLNDQVADGTPHLIIVIDIKTNSINEDEIESLSQIRKKHSNYRQTCFWINKNRDAIHMMFCNDDMAFYDFDSKGFKALLQKVYLSFRSR